MKSKNLIVVTLCILVMIMTVGYALFSTTLNINGTANIASKWDIKFKSITIKSKTSGAIELATPEVNGTSATFNVDLKSPGDKLVYEIDLANEGTLDAVINNVVLGDNGNKDITFNVEGVKVGDRLDKETSKKVIVTMEFKSSVTSQPSNTKNQLIVRIDVIQNSGQTITEEVPTVTQKLGTQILIDNNAQADTNINFGQISSDTNGKGLYYTSTNTEGGKPSYYFRGAVTNNYVKFAGYYWRIIRINEDGSIRLIYQGTTPTATGSNAQIGTSAFNNNMGDNAFVGYMYGKPTVYKDGSGNWHSSTSYWTRIAVGSTVKMSTSYTFNSTTGEYMLTNPIDGTYTSEYYNYYTCMSTIGVTCKLMMKLTEAATNDGYNELKGADTHSGYFSTSYEQAHKNEVSSTIKGVLDTWYKNNLTSYSSYIADSGFCNDRTLASGSGYGKNTNYYKTYQRLRNNQQPQYSCTEQKRDLFTVSNPKGNSALDYPIGLITSDEVAYAGGVYGSSYPNSSYYLYTGAYSWTTSPLAFYDSVSNAYEGYINSMGYLGDDHVYYNFGVRPVINLKSNIELISGFGTSNNPYIVKTN